MRHCLLIYIIPMLCGFMMSRAYRKDDCVTLSLAGAVLIAVLIIVSME
jgi:hypothetical protein